MKLNMQLAGRRNSEEKLAGRVQQQKVRWSALKVSLLALLFVVLAPVAGQCSISIMPMESLLQVSRPGARLTNDMEVYNTGNTPIHVTSQVMDWTMTASGQKQFQEGGTLPLSCAPWMQLNPVEFSLAPKQSMRVRYSVTPPADMIEEHRAMIFFTSRAVPTTSDDRFAISVQTRMGCKVLVIPTLKSPLQGKIVDMDVETPRVLTSEASDLSASPISLESPDAVSDGLPLLSKVKITFVNPNAVSVRLKGTIEARNADNQLVATGKITPAKALVLVGATRELWAQFDKPLPPDTYQIKATIDYGGKELVGGVLKARINLPTTTAQVAPQPSKTIR